MIGSEKSNKRFDRRKLLKQPVFPSRKISECFTEALSTKATELRPSTLRSYTSACRNFLRIMGDLNINEVTAREIDLFKSHRSKEVSPFSLNIDLRGLKSIFSTLLRWKYYETNPCQGVKLAKIPQVDPLFFTENQLRILFSAVDDETFLGLLKFGYYTGCRLSEIVFLRWVDVNFELRSISIRNSQFFVTKSQRNRIIPMSDSLQEILHHLYQIRRSDFIFSKNDGSVFKPTSINRKLKRVLKKLNFDKGYHFHSMRHTTASHLAQKNVSLYSISKILGHSSVKMSEKYAHLLPQNHIEIINKLNLNP